VIRAVVFAAVLSFAACTRIEPDAVPHVKLGMAPGDVRDRFEPGGPGTWQTSVGAAADDTAIEWKAKDASAKIREARFEFHLGMLVAVRAKTNEPPPSGEKITTTPASVTVRRAGAGGGSEVAVLARDCPTHKEEASALVAKAR
jgi:hypothetical protein